MCDARDRKSLLNAGRAHQRTCSDKQNIFVLSVCKTLHHMTADDTCRASASRTACVHVLRMRGIDHQSAVVINRADIIPHGIQQIRCDIMPDLSKIAGQNRVKRISRFTRCGKIAREGVDCRRSHRLRSSYCSASLSTSNRLSSICSRNSRSG